MKKNYLMAACLLVVSALSNSASAQVETFAGIKFGINAVKFNAGKDGYGGDYMAALNGGFYLEIKPGERFGIQPELLYSRQGAKSTIYKYNFDYVNVPLMLNFYITQKFYIQAGPQLGYLISAQENDGKKNFDVKENANLTDLTVASGLGYKFGILSISARYNHGITAVNKTPNRVSGVSAADDLTNRVFQFSLGLRLK